VAGDVEQEALCDASYAGGRGGPGRGARVSFSDVGNFRSCRLMEWDGWVDNTKERGRAGRRRAGDEAAARSG
jgi:hypothetical protein